jgi:phage baseplate assembly protein gpV
MIEQTIAGTSEPNADVQQKFYGVVVGRVINPLDPLTLGRVQVQLPFIDSLDLSPWARVAVPMAGPLHGDYFIPDVGTEVLVAFEQGDINAPYIIGSLWNAMSPPPLPSPVPQIRAIRTLVGNQIVFTEAPPTVTIQSGPTPPEVLPAPPTPPVPATIMLTPAGIQLIVGLNIVNLTPAGIQITSDTSVTIVAPAITLTSAANLTLAASGAVSIAGATVNITGGLVTIN